MQVVIFSSPNREEMLCNLLREFQGFDIAIIGDAGTWGKELFWQRWEQARKLCLDSRHDNYLILSDDGSNHDIHAIQKIHAKHYNKPFTCQIISDYRKSCWGSKRTRENDYMLDDYEVIDIGFFDCGGLTNRKTLEMFEVEDTGKRRKGLSSGVGQQLTAKLKALNVPMFKTIPSLSAHGDHPSSMHPHHRKEMPLIATVKRDKVIVGIATMKGREKQLKRAIRSLESQADQIIVYNNDAKGNTNYTDNAKFYALKNVKKPCYYFSCDDDIEYPPTYIEDMCEEIDKHNCIVTHHGRKLVSKDVSYYSGHDSFGCLRSNAVCKEIDVAGTGVTAFHTNYFNPTGIHKAKDQRMSDLVFSLEAAKERKRIVVLPHEKNYFRELHVPVNQTIWGTEHKNESRQIEIANEILSLKR